LTTIDGLIEDSALSREGQTSLYQTNATDIERRHIWSVPVAGGTPRQITVGRDAETDATPLSSEKYLAYLSYGVAQPPSVSVMSREGGAGRVIFPTLPKDFPRAAHVTPEIVIPSSRWNGDSQSGLRAEGSEAG
jgi:hypothetical protein